MPAGANNESGRDTVTLIREEGLAEARIVAVDDRELIPEDRGIHIPLVGSAITIGRSEDNDVVIHHKKLSRRHARLFFEGGKWLIEDLRSTNGVWINGERIGVHTLCHGDEIRLGPALFRVDMPEAAAAGTQDRPGRTQDDATVMAAEQEEAEGTLLLNDVRASEALLKAMESERAGAPSSETGPAGQPVAPSQTRHAVRTRARWPAAAAVVLTGLVAAGVWFAYFNGDRERDEIVAVLQTKFDGFIEDYETDTGERFDQSLRVLEELAAELNLAGSRYPDSLPLLEMQVRALFLKFEREFGAVLFTEEFDRMLTLIDETQLRLEVLLQRFAGGDSQASQVTTEVQSLLELAKIMARIRGFVLRFPRPAVDAPRQPEAVDLREARTWKEDFFRIKRANHFALSVTYPYFQRLVDRIDGQSLRVVNRWDNLLRRKKLRQE